MFVIKTLDEYKYIINLKENEIYFAGVDLLGGWLSEINITSPTSLQEIHKNSDLNPAKIFWDSLDSSR